MPGTGRLIDHDLRSLPFNLLYSGLVSLYWIGLVIRMLALDIDGTLTTSERSISDRTCAAVRKAVDSGLEVVLATNRRYRSSLLIADRVRGGRASGVCRGGPG